MSSIFDDLIFSIKDEEGFEKLALRIFNFQYKNNVVYREYVNLLRVRPSSVNSIYSIPFLPIEFFRNHLIITGPPEVKTMFESSGTTGEKKSRHYITDLRLYERSFRSSFRLFHGDPEEYFFAALLPSYTERKNSSLAYMAASLIGSSRDSRSNFFQDDSEALIRTLLSVKEEGVRGLLLGVSFALLDLAEKYPADLGGITIVETGGMKGRRKEIIREELHSILKKAFNSSAIHSEYGMTELLSQAWSAGEGIFITPPWMKVIIRDIYDPLCIIEEEGKTGGINIIDLANVNSCSFIATGDLGMLKSDSSFEVLGRYDNSDVRGCNLMVN
jgi:phenylacetate-coenzyme A ligase PaaK-like adenylate-forming protein